MSAIPVSYFHGRLCHQSQHLHTHQVPSFTNLVLCFHTFSGPSLLECREVMIESWELSVTVLMYQCPGLWPAISILCIGCVIARARPPTQGELTIGACNSCISMDGLCGLNVHVNPKSKMRFCNFNSTKCLWNSTSQRLPCWWFLGPLIRSSAAPCWWIPDWCSSWQLGDQLQLQLGELGPANNE